VKTGGDLLNCRNIAISPRVRSLILPLISLSRAWRGELQHIESQHPPDKKYCNNCPCDVNDPVANCFRFSEIEHDGIVARGAKRLTLTTFCFGCTDYHLTLQLVKNRHFAGNALDGEIAWLLQVTIITESTAFCARILQCSRFE